MNSNRTLSLLLTLVFLSAAAFAADPEGDAQQPRRGLPDELKLTTEQRTEMDQLRYQHEKGMIDLQAKLRKAELELEQLQREDDPNTKKIHAQIESIGALKTEMALKRSDHRLAMRTILTPEQRQIMMKREGMRHKRDDRHDRRGDRGPGRPGEGPFRKN